MRKAETADEGRMCMRDTIEKPRFICTGKEENYNVHTYAVDKNSSKKWNEYTIYNIVLSDGRVTTYFDDVSEAVEYAKKRLVVKGRGKVTKALAQILIQDSKTGAEHLVALVEKEIVRHYRMIGKPKEIKLEDEEM
jgi:predicted nucleotide-binding protein (sugar kinase/HSP70/actin superfamily)